MTGNFRPGLLFLKLLFISLVLLSFVPAFAQGTTDRPVPGSYIIIDSVTVTGNKLTKPYIIFREINFSAGDTVVADMLDPLMERNRSNILNTSLFNSVEIHIRHIDSVHVSVNIFLAERWYVWPKPLFELADRNFNVWWQTKEIARTNYGLDLAMNNCRGRNETLRLTYRIGYSQKYALSYTIPYLSKNMSGGVSFSCSYITGHETSYKTYDNKLLFYNDPSRYTRSEYAYAVKYSSRAGIYNRHYLALEYKSNIIADSIARLNPDYFFRGRTSQQYVSFSYLFKRDMRDYIAYPLKGYYYDFEVMKKGFGFPFENIDLMHVVASYKQYWQLSKRWYFASMLKTKLSGPAPQPYFNERGLGYGSDYVRSYEYYVVDGENFLLMKSNLKYELISPHVIRTRLIPLEKFRTVPYTYYINFFFDAGYVWESRHALYSTNTLTNSILPGVGVGIDYVTYYSMVFRAEYAINKFLEHDIFLHLSIPI